MEEQVSHISDLEGLNSELEGFLSDLHGREEALSVRLKTLEAELARRTEDAVRLLEDSKAALAEKETLLKDARAAAKEEAARSSAAIEGLRGSLLTESSRVAVLAAERDGLLRQVEDISGRLKEAKAAAADKEALLKEARALAKQDAAGAAAVAEELRASLNNESSRASSLALERDDLARRLQSLMEVLDEAKGALGQKDALMKEARAAAKEKAAELSGVIDQLRASLEEEGAKIAALISERNGLLGQLEAAAPRLEEEKAVSSKKDVLLNETRAAAKARAAELSVTIDQLKASLLEENSRYEALELERDGLLRRLETEIKQHEGEKARSAEKEHLINGARAALKAKEEEIEKILLGAAELKADLALERESVKDREVQLQKALKLREGLERKLEQAAQENLRSEEGFLLKIDLVKKELAEHGKRTGEIERKLAAAGSRLDDALDEARKNEKMLAEANAALAEKDAQLKAANLQLKELTKQFSEVKSGAGHENIQRAREMAASMAARVEELENAMSEAEVRSLDKFRASQAELSGAKTALRVKEEENAGLIARENSLLSELSDAEEKWKLASAQLHNAVSRLRNAENENEIALGRLKSVEEERNKFRAAAIKAETAASAMAARESSARDGEASGLMAALEEQAAKYTDMLRKYDDILLHNETLALEKAEAGAEADSLRAALSAAQAAAGVESGEKRGLQADLAGKLRGAEALLKKREAELEEALGALKSAQDAAETATGEKKGLQSGLAEKLRGAEALLRKKEFELEEARTAAASAGAEADSLRAHLRETAASAAGEAEAERVRYAALSERMHNADALLRKKEFELDEARGALFALENECSLLRQSRAALGEKYSREIHAENELLKEAQARVVERDSFIARLSLAEEELKKETEALKKEKQNLLSLVRKKSAAPAHSIKVSEAERMLAEKESRLVKLRAELENTRAEKAELQGREKELREELKARPYRAMLREAEENLLVKEKMLAEVTSRMKKIGRDFEDLKIRGQASGAPGYIPDFEELVAGVAHQVANSISIIRSHAEFCAETPEAEGVRESLDVIVRNIVNLQKKIDIIMNFSKPVIPQRSPERLATVLSEVVNGLSASGRLQNVRVSVKGGEKLKPVNLDRVRFASAVEQLLLNAAEAMPGGGEVVVSLSGGAGRQRLEVADTGAGVEKKNLGAVFHPFFTTRPGKMGLGLTLARNVARAHGGTLELLSEPGQGARAVLELPEI